MLTTAKSTRCLIDNLSFTTLNELQTEYGGFYQQMVSALIRGTNTKRFLRQLADRLVVIAEQSYTFRHLEVLEAASQALQSLPFPSQYKAIGQYYKALTMQRLGQGKIEQAARLLECASENAPPLYRLRAIQSLAANRYYRGDYKSALSLYNEASRVNVRSSLYDLYTLIGTQRMVAVIGSIEGNHKSAIALLENLLPIASDVRASYPMIYYEYLNSLAVELGEVGRIEEASNICRVVLASPFASAYPEWRETCDEIQLKSYRAPRSVISLAQRSTATILQLPEREPSPDVARPWMQPAQVLSLLDWKNKMVKQPNGNDDAEKLPDNISGGDMVMKLLKMMSQDDVTDEQRRKVLEYAIKVLSRQGKE